MIRLEVPLIPPSPNILRRQYRHPHAYRRLRTIWEHSISYAIGSATLRNYLLQSAKNHRVRVKITVFHAGRYDPDNLRACVKPVLDALRNVGFIHDDSDQWLELLPTEQFDGRETRNRKTVVEIEAV